MYAILMTLFILLSFCLAGFVLLQQGKGDLGFSNLQGSQMLFGASGGQNFFERATWIMGFLFILGALGLAIMKSKESRSSILEGVTKRAAQTTAADKVAAESVEHAAQQQELSDKDQSQ